MHNALSLQGMFDDTTRLPSGLIVPTHSAQDLIKSEAKRQLKEENKASFFSKFALGANSSQGAREKPGGTPQFALLYEAAEKSTIDRILIRARTDQTKRIWQKANDGKSKEVGYRVVHERQDDPDYKVTANDKERCREMEKLIGDPTPTEHMWLYPHQVRPHTRLKDLVGVLTQAELIIDRKVILRYKRRDGQGYSAFHWLPGETVKNVDESIRAWAQKNEAGGKVTKYTIDRMSYLTGFDLARASYVQMIDGMITGAFTDDEISVHISNPSDRLNRFGYGSSRLEESLDFTTNLLMAFNYNKEAFKTNYPEQILTIAGDYDKEGLAAFKQQILGEAGGVGQNWRLPVIPAGDMENFKIESVKLRETPKDMLFDKMIELLISLKCFEYNTIVETLEYGKMWIGKIAVNKMPVHIKSFDRQTGEVSYQKVVDWQRMRADKWVKLHYAAGNGKRSLDVTYDHELWNGKEMVAAGTMKPGDDIYVASPTLTAEQEQVILGSLLGDGTITRENSSDSYCVPALTESHSESQTDYAMWKVAAYKNLGATHRTSFNTAVKNGTQKYAAICFSTKTSPVLQQYRDICHQDGIKRVTWEWLDKLGILGLAIWFMDDGSFHKQKQQLRYGSMISLMPGTPEEMSFYFRYFAEKWNLHPRIYPVKKGKCWRLRFSADETEILRTMLSPYLRIAPPISRTSPLKKQWVAGAITIGKEKGLVPIKLREVIHHEYAGGHPCYDVTVEGTHTLFANDVASSNCSAYGAHPSTLNLSTYAGTSGNSGGLGGYNPADEIEFSKERGLIPALSDMAEWLTDAVLKPRYDDLKIIIVGMNPEDEKATVDIRTSRVSKWISRNEARLEEGGLPLGFYLTPEKYNKLAEDSPDKKRYDTNAYNWPADVACVNYINTFSQLEQQEQQDDDQGEGPNAQADQQDQGDPQDDSNQYYKSLRKSQPSRDVKFLKITLD